jgi:hypothetical protein
LKDFTFENHGSLWLLWANNEKALKYLKSVASAEAIWYAGCGIALEPRYVHYFREGLVAEGFGVLNQ